MNMGQQADSLRDWEKFLDPDTLKMNLIRGSVFLSSYELLKSAIVDNPHGFFNMAQTPPVSDTAEYKSEVLALNPKDRFNASCLWFKKMDAIDDADIEIIQEIRAHRNNIAHELPNFLIDSHFAVNMQLLDSIQFMLAKIERWWIREVDMPVNPDYDNVDISTIPDAEISSGRLVMMNLILSIIHGREEDLRHILAIVKRSRGNRRGHSTNNTPEL